MAHRPSRLTARLSGRTLALAVGILLLLTVFVLANHVFHFEELLKPERIASWLDEVGPLAPLVLILMMAVAVIISPIPSLPLDLAAGAAFGPVLGMTYAVIGAEIGAIISFLIGRALGRELLSKFLRQDIVFCEKCSDRHLALLLVLARLIPVFSFDIISYGAGLTNISLRIFAITTLVGMIPPTFALTYLGGSVVVAQWPVILLGLAMVALFFLMPKLVLRYPSAWWAQLLLAAKPAPVPVQSQQNQPDIENEPGPSCSGCGASLD